VACSEHADAAEVLSSTDVHYVVGFLSRLAGPDGVELELGAMVLDTDAEEERDVDITLRTVSGLRCVLGIEVKREKRRLDVIRVEQLCAKLNAMPDLTKRAIVSASGYYDPARRKAEALGVELLRLDAWDREKRPFGATELPPQFRWTNRELGWEDAHVVFDIDWEGRKAEKLKVRTPVTGGDGKPIVGMPDVAALSERILRTYASPKVSDRVISAVPDGALVPFKEHVAVGGELRVWRGKKSGVVRGALVKGQFVWRSRVQEPEFMILVNDSDDSPVVACAISASPSGDLCGMVLKAEVAPLSLFVVPISDRNKTKIRREKCLQGRW